MNQPLDFGFARYRVRPGMTAAYLTGARLRSANSFMTPAAVSSIERRVTSMLGQLCLAHSLRE
jgi:hypothetical protein